MGQTISGIPSNTPFFETTRQTSQAGSRSNQYQWWTGRRWGFLVPPGDDVVWMKRGNIEIMNHVRKCGFVVDDCCYSGCHLKMLGLLSCLINGSSYVNSFAPAPHHIRGTGCKPGVQNFLFCLLLLPSLESCLPRCNMNGYGDVL